MEAANVRDVKWKQQTLTEAFDKTKMYDRKSQQAQELNNTVAFEAFLCNSAYDVVQTNLIPEYEINSTE